MKFNIICIKLDQKNNKNLNFGLLRLFKFKKNEIPRFFSEVTFQSCYIPRCSLQCAYVTEQYEQGWQSSMELVYIVV